MFKTLSRTVMTNDDNRRMEENNEGAVKNVVVVARIRVNLFLSICGQYLLFDIFIYMKFIYLDILDKNYYYTRRRVSLMRLYIYSLYIYSL